MNATVSTAICGEALAKRRFARSKPQGGVERYLRCRIFARMRRFLRPTLRRPLPRRLAAMNCSICQIDPLSV
jgi:hypothetical protein